VFNLSLFYYPVAAVLLVLYSNAVNLTDGLDGLAIGLVIMVGLSLAVISYVTSRSDYAAYLQIPYVKQGGEIAVFCLALVGASVGFLWFNSQPAEVWMGDTGALSLGGAFGVAAMPTFQVLKDGKAVGSVTGGGNVALITGGGTGAVTIDTDQPEMAIGTPTGYYHIPLSFDFAGQVDIDADVEEGNVILFADTVKIIPLPIAASSTVKTPVNLLGGGSACISYAQSSVTTDITDPVCSMLLAYATIQGSEVTAAGYAQGDFRAHWAPPFPILLNSTAGFRSSNRASTWAACESVTSK
jgi:hypothetical protein